MAEINTLLDFARHLRGWDETKVVDGEETIVHHDGVYELAKAEAQQIFSDKVKALSGSKEMVGDELVETPGALKSHQELIDQLAELEQRLNSIRKQIGQVLMPSDRQGLVDQERQLILELRKSRAEILVSEAELHTLESEKKIAEAELERVESALKQSDGMLKEAEERDRLHSEWKKAIEADGIVDQLKNEAGARLDERDAFVAEGEETPLIQQAKLRVEGDIPETLRTRARERAMQVDSELAGHQGQIDTLEGDKMAHKDSTQGIAGLAAQRWWSFGKAEAKFQELVQQSPVHYEQAMALLKIVVDSEPLTEEQSSRIAEVAIDEAEPNALSQEKKLHEARAAVAEAEADVQLKTLEVELAIVQALAKSPGSDPDTDAQVISTRAELEDAETALDNARSEFATAESEFDSDKAEKLDIWEAAVPDHIWANLVAYDDAVTLLTQITNSDPATLATAMDSAEVSLVDALELEERDRRAVDELETRLLRLEKQLENLRNAHHPRKLSAVRGDA